MLQDNPVQGVLEIRAVVAILQLYMTSQGLYTFL